MPYLHILLKKQLTFIHPALEICTVDGKRLLIMSVINKKIGPTFRIALVILFSICMKYHLPQKTPLRQKLKKFKSFIQNLYKHLNSELIFILYLLLNHIKIGCNCRSNTFLLITLYVNIIIHTIYFLRLVI